MISVTVVGAFLIPYILSLALVGLPAFFMELAFGQFASLGPITIWRVCPLFKGQLSFLQKYAFLFPPFKYILKAFFNFSFCGCPTGIGFASVIISALVAISYNVVIAYAMYFLIVSIVHMDTNVPWATCGNDWNTIYCRTETLRISPGMNESEKVNVTLSRCQQPRFVSTYTSP